MQFNVFNNELEELTVNPQSLTAHCWIWHCFYPAESHRKPNRIELKCHYIHIVCVRVCLLYDARRIVIVVDDVVVVVVLIVRFTTTTLDNTAHINNGIYFGLNSPPPNQYNNRQPIVKIYIYILSVVKFRRRSHTHRHCVQTGGCWCVCVNWVNLYYEPRSNWIFHMTGCQHLSV